MDMALEWTHQDCRNPDCDGTTECHAFPTVADRIRMARAAYEVYAEADDTSLLDFALDVLLLAQSENVNDVTLLPLLARHASNEWWAYAKHNRSRRRPR